MIHCGQLLILQWTLTKIQLDLPYMTKPKMQRFIDRLGGGGHLLEFDHRSSLPRIDPNTSFFLAENLLHAISRLCNYMLQVKFGFG